MTPDQTRIIDIIDHLKATSGANNKKDILRKHQGNVVLVETLKAALDPYIVFYATELPPPNKDNTAYYDEGIIASTLLACDLGADREFIKNTIQWVSNVCGMDDRKRSFWSSVVAKDINCGVGAKTVNKVLGEVVSIFQPMKGEEASHLDKMEYPLLVQDKLDGTRCLIYIDTVYDDEVVIFSSSGRPYPGFSLLKSQLKEIGEACGLIQPIFIDSELVFMDEDGEPLVREISNGLANRALYGSLGVDDERSGVFYCFDLMGENALSKGDSISYSVRHDALDSFIREFDQTFFDSNQLSFVEATLCRDRQDVNDLYDKAVEHRKEGIMVKSLHHPYEPKRSKHWCKIKREYTVSLEVTGVKPHKKKPGQIGSLDVQSSDGVIKGNVGSGLSDEDRLRDDMLGRIVEVKIHDLTIKKGQHSLYLPRFIEVRTDKDEADDSDKIFDMTKWDR